MRKISRKGAKAQRRKGKNEKENQSLIPFGNSLISLNLCVFDVMKQAPPAESGYTQGVLGLRSQKEVPDDSILRS